MSELEDLIAQGVVEPRKRGPAKSRDSGEPLAWEVRTPDGALHDFLHRDRRDWADPEATARRMAGVIGGYVVGLSAPQDGEREDGDVADVGPIKGMLPWRVADAASAMATGTYTKAEADHLLTAANVILHRLGLPLARLTSSPESAIPTRIPVQIILDRVAGKGSWGDADLREILRLTSSPSEPDRDVAQDEEKCAECGRPVWSIVHAPESLGLPNAHRFASPSERASTAADGGEDYEGREPDAMCHATHWRRHLDEWGGELTVRPYDPEKCRGDGRPPWPVYIGATPSPVHPAREAELRQLLGAALIRLRELGDTTFSLQPSSEPLAEIKTKEPLAFREPSSEPEPVAWRKILEDLCIRAERAREILQWKGGGNWGMLDTCDAREALAHPSPSEPPDVVEKERLIAFAQQIWEDAVRMERGQFVATWAGNLIPASHVIVSGPSEPRGETDNGADGGGVAGSEALVERVRDEVRGQPPTSFHVMHRDETVPVRISVGFIRDLFAQEPGARQRHYGTHLNAWTALKNAVRTNEVVSLDPSEAEAILYDRARLARPESREGADG